MVRSRLFGSLLAGSARFPPRVNNLEFGRVSALARPASRSYTRLSPICATVPIRNAAVRVCGGKIHVNKPISSIRPIATSSDAKHDADPDLAKPTLEIDPFKKSLRKGRPLSPHFTIYQPQITWIGSILHRVTGSGISLGLSSATPYQRHAFH